MSNFHLALTGDPPHTPVDRLHRIRIFVDVLRDALTVAGNDYSPHLEERTVICDYVSDELTAIAHTIEQEK